MKKNITTHIKPLRLDGLPAEMRRALREAREKRDWSQRELGSRLGLPQMHISGIESGKIVPRYDTLLELVRVLDRDLLMVPRALVPCAPVFRGLRVACTRGLGRCRLGDRRYPAYLLVHRLFIQTLSRALSRLYVAQN